MNVICRGVFLLFSLSFIIPVKDSSGCHLLANTRNVSSSSMNNNSYRVYETLRDLVEDNSIIKDGITCFTKGYHKLNDGGGATYYISTKKPASYYVQLNNGMYAQLVDDKHNIRCYGATVGMDCTTSIRSAIDANKGGYIVIPDGRFKIEHTVRLEDGSISIIGKGDASVLYVESDITLFDISNKSAQRLTIKDVCFEGKVCGKALSLGNAGFCLNTLIEHCSFRNFEYAIALNKEVDNITIRDCYFLMNKNGVYSTDISTNKSGVRIQGNHFQMQRNGGISVYLEIGSSVNVSDNLFQAAHRKDIVFMKLYDMNQVVVANNYLEVSDSPDPSNNIGIDINYLNGATISHTRAQGYMHSVVRVLNSYSTEIGRIVYSPLGYKIPSVIENKAGQKRKHVILDVSEQSALSTKGSYKYLDNKEGVTFSR